MRQVCACLLYNFCYTIRVDSGKNNDLLERIPLWPLRLKENSSPSCAKFYPQKTSFFVAVQSKNFVILTRTPFWYGCRVWQTNSVTVWDKRTDAYTPFARSSKRLANVVKIHVLIARRLLDVCWTFAGSCKRCIRATIAKTRLAHLLSRVKKARINAMCIHASHAFRGGWKLRFVYG